MGGIARKIDGFGGIMYNKTDHCLCNLTTVGRTVDLVGTEPGSGDPFRELKAERHIEVHTY